jgi:hypothetical protein
MKVRFLVDYRGVLTQEQFFPAGTVADVPSAGALIEQGRAVPVEEEPPKPKAPPKRKKNVPRRKVDGDDG